VPDPRARLGTTSDLLVSASSAATTSSLPSAASATTSSAASTEKGPTKTQSRSSTVRSASLSRS
jgi:hypothetical protein